MDKRMLQGISKRISQSSASKQDIETYCNLLNAYIKQNDSWKDVSPNLKAHIAVQLKKRISSQINKEERLWRKMISIAAIFICILGISLILYQNSTSITDANHYDVGPGESNATLTLSNGRIVTLSDISKGQVINEAGVKIYKDDNNQIVYQVDQNTIINNAENILSTTRGQTCKVKLPDGSLIWLNASSSMRYPTTFSKDHRKVVLEGEAYFEVEKSRKQFIVQTKDQEITVLGTHFNVDAYPDGQYNRTSLLEGSVQVNAWGKTVMLKPNQQAIINTDKQKIQIKSEDMSSTILWKDGIFRFNDASIYDVMKQIQRWYDIDVEYIGDFSAIRISGGTYKNKKLSEVIQVLKLNGLDIVLKERTVTLKQPINK